MTKISRRIINWILGAFAFVALVFGTVFALPQVEIAKAADTAVTFSSAVVEGEDNELEGYVQIRMDTDKLEWTNSQNRKTVAELPSSIVDYTTINGRTLTELQSACPSDLPIRITLQPAGSFSFIRVWVPTDFMRKSEVRSLGVLDGWAYNDGTANYTSSTVTFLYSGSMMKAENYTATPKLTAADITISDAKLSHRIDAHAKRGADSYVVDINIGKTYGEYDAMYSAFAKVRDSIYINGKSIDEWNEQMIAQDARFNEPSSYTYFPQNSTDPSHKDYFVKPVGLWGTATGFRVSIYQELLADAETITVTVGSGALKDGDFMVAERVSKTVFTQNVVNLVDKLSFLDNTANANYNNTTNTYYIHTNNETCWTEAPKGGCLNEYDPADAGGGQIQMKYVTFNGSTLWDINKNDQGSYGSEQGNIASGGGYAPILVTMTPEVGSSLKLAVPMNYTNGKAAHEEIVIKKGFSVYVNGTSYYVSNDVVFKNNGSSWTKEVKPLEVETEVTGIITKANRTDGGNNENFIIFQLSNNDYAACSTTAIKDISSLYGYIDINGNVLSSKPGEPFFNVWGTPNSVAFRAPGLDAAGLQQVEYITIKAGAKFPSYNVQYNGAPLTYYVTTEDITFIHNIPNDTWTVGTIASEFTVTYEVDGATYTTQTVARGATATAPTAPTKAADDNYTYTFKQWNLNGTAYDFNTPVNANITLVAEFDATQKTSDVDVTNELSFGHQNQQSAGTETYLIKTVNNYWTKAPQGGCLNEADPQSAGGGQEQMKYIYFNGTSLYDINKNDNGSYGSAQGNIASGGVYAPILVMMGTDGGNYSYVQLHVPTGYPNAGASANENHKSIEIKAGFSVTENGVTYVITQDRKWVNLNGTWTDANNVLSASAVTIGDAYLDGEQSELVVVDITSSSWNFVRDPFDYNYYGSEVLVALRKNIFINGVSVFDINTMVDDSHYNYVTHPQTLGSTGAYNGATYEIFANPVLMYATGNTLSVKIHKDYIDSLGAGDITVTVGAGFIGFAGKDAAGNDKFSYPLGENKSKVVTTMYTVMVDGATQFVLKGGKAVEPSIPQKDMTGTATYVFDNWYDVATDTVFSFDTVITKDYEIEARFTETTINIIKTEITGIVHYLRTERNDTWMVFQLSNNDYASNLNTAQVGADSASGYAELLRIGFLDRITLKGSIQKANGSYVSQATLKEVYNWYGALEGPFYNIWGQPGTLAIRVPVGAGVDEIVIESGCFFPSYKYTSGATTTDTRYAIMQTAAYRFNDGVYNKESVIAVDIQMAMGAGVRMAGDENNSGIRFETKIAKASVALLEEAVAKGTYTSISFGTLIVPKDYLMGGLFTHEWLDKNQLSYLDIKSTAYENGVAYFPKEDGDYYSYFGSIVKLKEGNYSREFAGIGYIAFEKDGVVTYAYAEYDPANARSASFIANAAINDRSATQSNNYPNYISENNNYSPYTQANIDFLERYLTWSETSAINSEVLTNLANKGGSNTITPTTQKLAGPYVELLYSTNVNVWGQFTYTDGSKTATEDFYLQAGTTHHKQYLDIFRENAVGVGMNADNLSMTSITFTNAELKQEKTGKVKVIALYSQDKTIDMANQEIYLTVNQADGSEITVGAHLGLGGALTYLAKSGIYEGVTSSSYSSGNVKISTNTSDFVSERNTNFFGTSKEKGYYGHATSSKAADGAVNLINNVDAGRQIQQSWYASVGGATDGTGNGSNGYTRAFCKTESASGKYWPYNPVQAGDVVSNPSQIVDYEINEKLGYIYVKTRAMDWAKGQKSSDKLANTLVGGSTTKSYMENYYRLNDDGTLTVNNSYVDWNGFTDMELCGWASTELPAVYPVHTLNYYVSNLDGDGSWTDGLEYKNGLGNWTGDNACRQGTTTNESVPHTKVEEWFAWANGGNGSAFALGMYIPNVSRFTSGRARTTTAMSESLNKDAKTGNVLSQKGLMSNMQPIQYTYQSAYVTNTSYTAPGVEFRMEAYKPIEYSYVICLGTVDTIRSTFKAIKDNGTITNAGNGYEKVGLDAWARADKMWTW